MNYTFVSADCHMDLSWLPGDLFTKNAPQHLVSRVPHVIEAPTKENKYGLFNAIWVADGKELGVYGGTGFGFGPPERGISARTDRMWEAGYYDGDPHVIDPELRLKDLELDGPQAEMIYGMTGAGIKIKDPEVLTATYRIYNDWIADFCNTTPGRFYGLACISVHDPKEAASELRRAATLGPLRGVDLIASEVTHPIYTRDGYWDPLWEAVAETQMPISFHLGGARLPVPPPPGESTELGTLNLGRSMSQNELAYQGTWLPLGMLSGSQWLAGIIMSGVCEKIPDFRFVMGEMGGSWIPFVLGRMDHIFHERHLDEKFSPPMSLLPSEYWYRQGATTFQEEPEVGKMADLIGVNNLMWGSDYPHPDGVWPDSKSVIQKTLGNLDEESFRKITCDNAVKLYRMGE
jgi:predicted TIM-barrel fold metal-dependent hydrolase